MPLGVTAARRGIQDILQNILDDSSSSEDLLDVPKVLSVPAEPAPPLPEEIIDMPLVQPHHPHQGDGSGMHCSSSTSNEDTCSFAPPPAVSPEGNTKHSTTSAQQKSHVLDASRLALVAPVDVVPPPFPREQRHVFCRNQRRPFTVNDDEEEDALLAHQPECPTYFTIAQFQAACRERDELRDEVAALQEELRDSRVSVNYLRSTWEAMHCRDVSPDELSRIEEGHSAQVRLLEDSIKRLERERDAAIAERNRLLLLDDTCDRDNGDGMVGSARSSNNSDGETIQNARAVRSSSLTALMTAPSGRRKSNDRGAKIAVVQTDRIKMVDQTVQASLQPQSSRVPVVASRSVSTDCRDMMPNAKITSDATTMADLTPPVLIPDQALSNELAPRNNNAARRKREVTLSPMFFGPLTVACSDRKPLPCQTCLQFGRRKAMSHSVGTSTAASGMAGFGLATPDTPRRGPVGMEKGTQMEQSGVLVAGMKVTGISRHTQTLEQLGEKEQLILQRAVPPKLHLPLHSASTARKAASPLPKERRRRSSLPYVRQGSLAAETLLASRSKPQSIHAVLSAADDAARLVSNLKRIVPHLVLERSTEQQQQLRELPVPMKNEVNESVAAAGALLEAVSALRLLANDITRNRTQAAMPQQQHPPQELDRHVEVQTSPDPRGSNLNSLSRSPPSTADSYARAEEEAAEMEWPRRVLPAPTLRRQDAWTSPLRQSAQGSSNTPQKVTSRERNWERLLIVAEEQHARDAICLEQSTTIATRSQKFVQLISASWHRIVNGERHAWREAALASERIAAERLEEKDRLARTTAAKLAELQDFWKTAQATFKESVACLRDENAALRAALASRAPSVGSRSSGSGAVQRK